MDINDPAPDLADDSGKQAEIMAMVRDAKPTDYGKPVPNSTPAGLNQPIPKAFEFPQNPPVSLDDVQSVVDTGAADPGGGGGGGGETATLGDMLYYDGSNWVSLPCPTVSASDPVLRHNGTSPYWEEPEGC